MRIFVVALLMFVGSVWAQEAEDRVGEVVVLQGRVLDVNGDPVQDEVVELWQTDANGTYNHPNDIESEDDLDPDFQYFGVSVTDEDGVYRFITYKPAAYGSRPPHLHLKVKVGDVTVLTTQFYFEEDAASVQNEGVFRAGGDTSLILTLEDTVDENGLPVRVAEKDIVVSPDGSTGELALTPSQAEGPYYPVVGFWIYDNDLTFTPLDVNSAHRYALVEIAGLDEEAAQAIEENRPYTSVTELDANPLLYVPVDVNEADVDTLKQIPGVTDEIAAALIEGRPYESNADFLAALGESGEEIDLMRAAKYLMVVED